MKKKETFTQSIFALMISQILIKGIGLFYKLYLTNRQGFGDEGNAIVSSAFQIYALLLSICAIGIPNAISRLVAKSSAIGDHKGAYRIFKIALFIFSTIGMLGSYLLFSNARYLANEYLHIKEAEYSIIALSPSIFLVAVISVFKGYFNGRESIKITAKAQSVDQVIKVFSTILLIELSAYFMKNENTILFSAIASFATTFGNLFEFGYLYKYYISNLKEIKFEMIGSVNSKRIRIREIIKEILIIAIPISLTALITTISKNIDSTTIVNKLTNIIGYEEAKKQYGILSGKVDSLINFPLSFNMAIATALLPSISANSQNIRKSESRINQAILIEMIIAIPVTLIYFVYSDEILKVLFPNASEGGMILKISSISIIFITIEQITNSIFQAMGKMLIPIKAIIAGVVIKAILNNLLVDKVNFILGGTNGTAFSTVICHLIVSTILIYKLAKSTNLKIEKMTLIKILIIAITSITISKIISNYVLSTLVGLKLNVLMSIGVFSLLYIILIFKIKIFTRKHFE